MNKVRIVYEENNERKTKLIKGDKISYSGNKVTVDDIEFNFEKIISCHYTRGN